MFPHFAAKTGGFFMLVFGMCALLGGLAQINPVWLYGPYDPSQVSAASQPDFYIGFLDGCTRLFMPWEFRGAGVTMSPLFWPTVVMPGILFTLLALWPWHRNRRCTGDDEFHNLLERPRDNPTRTGIGAMALAFYGVLMISGGNDVIATTFHISLNAMTWGGRFAAIAAPPIAFYVTRRICYALQAKDRELEEHGIETGHRPPAPVWRVRRGHAARSRPSRTWTSSRSRPTTSHRAPTGTDGGLLTRGRRAVTGFFVDEGDGDAGSREPEEPQAAGTRSRSLGCPPARLRPPPLPRSAGIVVATAAVTQHPSGVSGAWRPLVAQRRVGRPTRRLAAGAATAARPRQALPPSPGASTLSRWR